MKVIRKTEGMQHYTFLRITVKRTCYEQIRGNLGLCWSGKIKPKVIRTLENEGYN